MSETFDQLRKVVLWIDEGSEIGDWVFSISEDDDRWCCTAQIESDGESFGWVVTCRESGCALSFRAGWYRQEVETERLEDLPALARALIDAYWRFNLALDEHGV